MNVLVLAALTDATGNATTARRIAAHLEGEHTVHLVDANELTIPALREIAAERRIDIAVGVHALLAGPFLRALGIPYTLIFGGTDLYETMHDLQQTQMARAVAGAARLIAFSPENTARAEWMWPPIAGRVELLPQSVDIPPADDSFSLRARLGLGKSDVLVVLPTGIRRVKDPLHVVEAMSVWHVVHPRVHLAIAGAVLEHEYADDALRTIADRPGVYFVDALPRPRMLAAIREADVVLNTSLSEGMCGALLEAMALGTPVVARRNAGNESLVTHGHTGLLYDAPGELVHWIGALVASPELRERLARTARARIESHHSMTGERDAYRTIVSELAERPSLLPPASLAVDELEVVLPAAQRIGLSPPVQDALAVMVKRVYAEPELFRTKHQLAGSLGTAPPSVAIDEIRKARLERTLDRDGARTFYLLLALLQIPAAEARHAARGIDADVTRSTLGDLALWAHQIHAQTGHAGITLETLEWAQRYLRGELVQLGPLQFDLRPFAGGIRVYRDHATGALEAESLDGRVVDLREGRVLDARAPLHENDGWELALEPGSPILDMWIPANTVVTLREVGESMRAAYKLFARLAPETIPVAVCGESWRLDPQVTALFPPESGIEALQRACKLYPSTLAEAKTIRRLFGPDVDRARLASLPHDRMHPLQRGVAAFLADPSHGLRARSGFVLRRDAEAMPEWA